MLQVAWEHEQFSKLRVTAATISELSVASELLERTGGLVDSRFSFLFSLTSLIAGTLLKFIDKDLLKCWFSAETLLMKLQSSKVSS